MKAFILLSLVALIHGSNAALLIKGPTEPVLEGQSVTIECRYANSEFNISEVQFQMLYKSSDRWHQIYGEYNFRRTWCYYSMRVMQTEDSLVLTIPYAGRYNSGPYRCVSSAENVTAPDNASEPLGFKVHYMAELSLSREGYRCLLGAPKELRVRQGDDVVLECSAASSEEPKYFWFKEGSDWILPSPKLTLKKVTASDQGQYTCSAEHSVQSLSKKRSISITVLPENAPWYQTSSGRLVLSTSLAAVALALFIITMTVFLCRRAKRARTSKGPIDDRSQKKPIYKSSVDSLPSTSGDKQPLV
ncbi:uncharacterized protein si:ch211-79k12.1 [Betta splendens]|uniref:Uncharacterized protein si:ch211-79k12.1 n=1 Tax=Betta splendens TaxID=158456 RepID=A0A6P7KU49_BETSP|nr:uncharacterized protein si:ch211-79k12.1 [Betta splendens]